MKALILAGGEGRRLRPLTNNLPKPMVKICHKPLLDYLIFGLKDHGIAEIVLAVHYQHQKIIDYFGDGSKFEVSITYSIEKKPLNTAGAMKLAEKYLDDSFVVLNGDVFQQMDLTRLINFHYHKNGIATIVIHSTNHPHDSDLVKIDANNQVRKFFRLKDKNNEFVNLANAGIFVFERKVLSYIPVQKKISIEKDLLPDLLQRGLLVFAYETDEFIKDIGTQERLERVEKYVSGNKQ